MDFPLAPAQIIIIGPSATLGNEFNIVKNGSTTFATNLKLYKNKAIKNPNEIPNKNAIITS